MISHNVTLSFLSEREYDQLLEFVSFFGFLLKTQDQDALPSVVSENAEGVQALYDAIFNDDDEVDDEPVEDDQYGACAGGDEPEEELPTMVTDVIDLGDVVVTVTYPAPDTEDDA